MGVGTLEMVGKSILEVGLNPFLVRVGVGTQGEDHIAVAHAVLIPSWLGWVLELNCQKIWYRMLRLNPFLVRVGVGTLDRGEFALEVCLNPFLVRVGVGTFTLRPIAADAQS